MSGENSGTEQRTRLRAPTMADVARLAGVSAQTVSRVLSGHPNVSELTRSQVQDAVERTGYRRTGLARALATGRSQTIGVVTYETDFYSRSAIMLGIQRATRGRGYSVSAAGTTSLATAAVGQAIERLRAQGVDGMVIALPIRDEPSLQELTEGIPTAVIDGLGSSADEIVAIDQVEAGRIATQHLLDLGHTTVWHLGGPAAWNDASGRTTGWQRALEEAGRAVPPVLYGDWSAESGYRNGLVLGRLPDVTAVFAGSDEMAFGLIRALLDLGRRVPEDVSVVAMDDIALAQYCSPPLTTVRQPFQDMGRLAVEHVLALIDDPDAVRESVLVTPELVTRSSTAAPPA
ncbi:LacI family DNA-binding transcriptional regulator [Cellulomonas hominis]|uniref:LacI family DNA-binding transcriptional regulator n=1 Tax=Cellulomonas hominis TaxID=156981 RepID=UPI001C113738|nr:LacI family DNA-binding transcriptional regulator [Cellulomonas hominis]MBU5422989.1 LacI family DNA-binding transcriptional regulator [Cellulomonas hominis]